MNKAKRQQLEANGWKVGTVAEFLELTPEEAALIEIRLVLNQYLKQKRESSATKTEQPEKNGSTKAQPGKADSRDTWLSLYLLVRAMLATGATSSEIDKAVTSAKLLAEMK